MPESTISGQSNMQFLKKTKNITNMGISGRNSTFLINRWYTTMEKQTGILDSLDSIGASSIDVKQACYQEGVS